MRHRSVLFAFLVVVGLSGLAFVIGRSQDAGERGAASAPASTMIDAAAPTTQAVVEADAYVGSSECRGCHARFYTKWSTSRHGLAMQPVTEAFVHEQLTPPGNAIAVGDERYDIALASDPPVVIAKGPSGEQPYPIQHALGGKNVYFFLTPFPGGRLQVLPVAYDVRKKEWYDTTGSMVRHFHDEGSRSDAPIDWRERPLTFNASCYHCHVSQLSNHYIPAEDAYRTTWKEPGINCEACHGPGGEHVRAMKEAGETPPDDLHIIVTKSFSAPQINSMCAPCHAKMRPISKGLVPGEKFLDHYDLIGLEDRDFYPDGRDLGENFTMTLWQMSPCLESGEFDCMHCHTSSGRFRFDKQTANNACLPCHEPYVRDPAAHSHHAADSEGSLCIRCHMPETTFARMRRHDHTMLPPTPATAREFGSPDACVLCHTNHDATWADEWVGKWYGKEYQQPYLERARLIAAARREDWSRLQDMLAYLRRPDHNEVFAASLVRLLESCDDARKWPVVADQLDDPSPLVRAAAAHSLAGQGNLGALVKAASDPIGLVRMRGAEALTHFNLSPLPPAQRQSAQQAIAGYEAFLQSRNDDPLAYYNLGILYDARQRYDQAARMYETSLRMQPDFVPAMVNASVTYAALHDSTSAEKMLRQAIATDPHHAEARFNLALLLAEQGQTSEAEASLRDVIRQRPDFAEAQYNLAVLLADRDLREAIAHAKKAASQRPNDPKYVYALAFYLSRAGDLEAATQTLRGLIDAHPDLADAYRLLGTLYIQSGDAEAARDVYERAAARPELPAEEQNYFRRQRQLLEP